VACKANPLKAMLKIAADQGFGCEVASLPELIHALSIFDPSRIVFDSPAKTVSEIKFALGKGVLLNTDNLQEVYRISDLMNTPEAKNYPSPKIGLRVNPQTGAGSICETSTATATSKFGYPIEHRKAIIDVYSKFSWLTGIHVHTGSQGCNFELLVDGIVIIIELISEINSIRSSKKFPLVSILDIGGGHPVDYKTGGEPIDFKNYVEEIKKRVPELWDTRFQIITEFGRSLSATAGVAISKVEYTKLAGGSKIATVHCGADFMLRNAYMPDKWQHRVSVYSPLCEKNQPSLPRK